MQTPRPEYPRPQFVRQDWLNLNGTWGFAFDDDNRGMEEQWYAGREYTGQIMVPFPFQSELSGVCETGFHDWAWYRRQFTIPEEWQGRRIILHFGAVDYRAWVWVNGSLVVFHEGGHTSFQAEITHALHEGENEIVVRVEDISTDRGHPRGKQYWERYSKGIFYTRTTGIWQTVWIEPVGQTWLERAKITPDIDSGAVTVDYIADGVAPGQQIEIEVSFAGQVVAKDASALARSGSRAIVLDDFVRDKAGRLWSPEQPNLYDIAFRIRHYGRVLDEVTSYFGMRKISVKDGRVMLNGSPYYMKLVLDQGYFPQGLLTAPADMDLKRDIELTKEMGFNGARKHQKIEDPRYLYWADRLGFLVWEEMPSCHVYTDESICRIMAEWQEAIQRDYNHPCIVAWVPLNESWGVPKLSTDPQQANHTLTLYHLTRSLDPSRPVISNDGWEHTHSDLCTIHDYASDKQVLRRRYSSVRRVVNFKPSERNLYVPGFAYCGEPIIVSEFGGIAYKKSNWEGWGYSAATSDGEFVERYYDVVSALLESPLVQGFCYTQLTDVEQEINGLLTYDRRPKVPLGTIRAINEGCEDGMEEAGRRASKPRLAWQGT